MENFIRNAYQALDDKLMQGANAALRAWNWTTGETKADLANKLLALGTISTTAGFLLHKYSFFQAASFLFPGYWYLQRRQNSRMEKLEESARENSYQNLEVEIFKKQVESLCPVSLVAPITGVSAFPYIENEDRLSSALRTVGLSLLSSSFYIMRSDVLPPRKNCFSRGVDKLKELWQKYSKPQVATAGATA